MRIQWAVILVAACGCSHNAGRLAGVGAVTGAMAGSAISGHGKGALIGSAIGAVSGAAVGGAIDDEAARNEALIAQRMGRPLQGAVSFDQVVAMTQAGLSDSVISTHITTYGVARPPNANDLIQLRQAGVGDGVLQTLQSAGAPRVVQASAPPPPVIIQERWSPVIHVPVRPRPYCGPRVGWGFHYHHH